MQKRILLTKSMKTLLLAFVLFGGGFVLISQADSALSGNQPGSADDPLVTKSYVDEQIRVAIGGDLGGGSVATAQELNIVELRPGQVLSAKPGTEMIVRNGKTVVVSDSENGIPDVTAGVDILDGQEVETNHLLISPAAGRGIQPHESVTGTVFVMVRGDYTLD